MQTRRARRELRREHHVLRAGRGPRAPRDRCRRTPADRGVVQAAGRGHRSTAADGSWLTPTVTIETGALNLEAVEILPSECKSEGQQLVPAQLRITVAQVTGERLDAAL